MATIVAPLPIVGWQRNRRRTAVYLPATAPDRARWRRTDTRNDSPRQRSLAQLVALMARDAPYWPYGGWADRTRAQAARWTAGDAPAVDPYAYAASTPHELTTWAATRTGPRLTYRAAVSDAANLWALAIYASETGTTPDPWTVCRALHYWTSTAILLGQWTPPPGHTYDIWARAANTDGQWGPVTATITLTF